MSLDIRFTVKRDIICPHCGKVFKTEDGYSTKSGGRGWYPILEDLGYYVPYDKRTDANDWYGKDMVLTDEQLDEVYQFVKKHPDLYSATDVLGLIAMARYEKRSVAVNADW